MKSSPSWLFDGFVSLEAAREWARDFMVWYTEDHRHSCIRFVVAPKT